MNIQTDKYKLIIVALVSLAIPVNAQVTSQKIGTNPGTINANAALEIESTNKGLLLPRVALTATTSPAPLSADVAGMMVYNTATAGDVFPGYYYNNGTDWVRVSNAAGLASVNGTAPIAVANGTTAPVISLNDGGVTSTKILDGTIANIDLSAGVGGLYKGSGSLSATTTVTQAANNLSFSGTGTLIKLSGAAGSNAIINLGRTSNETELGVAGSSGQGFPNVIAADTWLRSNGSLYLGTLNASGLKLLTNNTERLIIASDGTTTINGGVALNTMSAFQTVGRLKLGRADGVDRSNYITTYNDGVAAANYMAMEVHNGTTGSAVEVMRLRGDGNVGIGTTSPSAPLHIVKSGIPQILLENYKATPLVTDALDSQIRLTSSHSNATWSIGTGAANSVTDNDALYFWKESGSYGAKMVIRNNGNVGLGTTTPTLGLDVRNSGGIGFSSSGAAYDHIYMTVNSYNGFIRSGGADNGLILQVGNGASGSYGEQTYFDVMTLRPTGFVGIGTTSPNEKLTVGSSSVAEPYAISITNSRSTGRMGISYNGGDYGAPYAGDFMIENNGNYGLGLRTNGANRMYITNTGNVGIGTTTPAAGNMLEVNGVVQMINWVKTSDARFKKDIEPIENALSKVLALRGITFNWDLSNAGNKNLDNNNHIGVLAQEVEQILPQVVSTADDAMKTKSVAYSDIIPVLIEAIKEQQKQIDELKNQIEQIKLNQK